MLKFSFIVAVLLLLAGCQKQDVRLKVLIGATTIPGTGEPTIPDSIIVIAGSKIRSVGARKDVPVPENSDRTEMNNEWIIPAQGSQILPGEVANLLILKHAPVGLSPASQSDVSARIENGEWVVPK